MSSLAKKSEKPALRSVATMPGATPFTRIPRCRYSAASALVSMSTPPFDAAYAAFHGLPTMPDTDVVLTITPPPASSRCGSAYRHTRNVPRRFTAMMRSNTAGSRVSVR